MTDFSISTVQALPQGQIALSPIPGSSGDFEADVAMILLWRPDLVISLTTDAEMGGLSEQDMAFRLYRNQVDWAHMPIADFGAPEPEALAIWRDLSPKVHEILQRGGRVLLHCRGGQGRSGMLAMRVLVEAGIAPDAALEAVRSARPGAVETEAQRLWAAQTRPDG